MKTQTRKLNMFKLFAAVLVLATILCGTMIGTGIYNASAEAESFTIEPGTTYAITYAIELLDRDRKINMSEYLKSITVKLYSKDDRELASFTREKKIIIAGSLPAMINILMINILMLTEKFGHILLHIRLKKAFTKAIIGQL